MTPRFLFASSFLALVVGCAGSATPDTAAASADYSSFTLLAKDTFACSLTDGRATTTATLTRTLSQSKIDPNERLFGEDLKIGEPVFTSALKKFGSYGCFHAENEGLDYSARVDHFAATTLPADAAFSYDAGLQWNNCEYEGTEAAHLVDGELTVALVRGNATVTFTGTCAKAN